MTVDNISGSSSPSHRGVPRRGPGLPGAVLMTAAAWLQLLALLVSARLGTRLLGPYLAGVFGDDEKAPGDRVFLPVERLIYRLCGIDPEREQRWSVYALSLLAFSFVSVLVALRCSSGCRAPAASTPTTSAAVPAPLSFNTAVSFVTNTNWQNYAGESTMSHLTQMAGLAVQNFVSAAVGLAVAVALIRGLARRRSAHDRQLLGRPRPRHRPHPAAARVRRSPSCSSARASIQNLHGITDGHHGRGRDAGDPRRAGRQPGGDQGARHQRRRLLQRQLGAPVREPERLHQLPRDLRCSC